MFPTMSNLQNTVILLEEILVTWLSGDREVGRKPADAIKDNVSKNIKHDLIWEHLCPSQIHFYLQ